MKLQVDGNRIVVSLADEGRADSFVVEACFRCVGGQVLPSVIFGQRGESAPATAASDLRRVVSMLGPAQVVPWSGRPFPLHAPQVTTPENSDSNGRFRSFPSFRKLGVIGVGKKQ